MSPMAAEDAPHEEGRPPSGPEPDDTPVASSEVAPACPPPRPAPLPLPLEPRETLDQTGSFPDLPRPPQHPIPSPRNGRSLSLAQISGPIKRKPLSSTASATAVRYSKGGYADVLADLPKPEQRFARSCSLDSPTLYEFPDKRSLLATNLPNTVDWPASPYSSRPSSFLTERFVQPEPPAPPPGDVPLQNVAGGNDSSAAVRPEDESLSAETASLSTHQSEPYELDYLYSAPQTPELQEAKRATVATVVETNIQTMSMFSRKSPPPQLSLATDTDLRPPAPIEPNNLNKPLPKSPASSKLSAFFGWATSPSPSTSTTDYSDKGFSPLPSPSSPKTATALTESYGTPVTAKTPPRFTNATERNHLHYCEAYLQTPSDSAPSLGQIEEMEDELKAISAELAQSIRREMDLEDLVERLQEQINNPQAPGKRTSDYFSDSGYSSAKFSDYDQAKEEIAQIQRKADQEKAQIRLELTNKLQDERSRRRLLDQQIQDLSKRASEFDVAQLNNREASGRVKELEEMCEDLSRRLSEERQLKNNFEDLLGALKGELQTASNERDNLRDEIVPQLRARVEGLEAEASEHAKLAYDTSKMQQELESLRSENAERARLAEEASKLQQELSLLRSENAELKQSGTRMSMALSRSASVTGGGYRKNRPQSISRSNSTRPTEPREVLADRLKDVEAQRDALHSALKSLLERQELQNRENAKRIRQLEMERDRLLAASPKKAGYERELCKLRDEISVLRRRSEEAIEQKWQVEKGLVGLKMDLDRAEEEIASLRGLLEEKDTLIAQAEHFSHVSSMSLEKAYRDLQDAYIEALERIRTLEENAVLDEKTQLAIQRLEQSLSAAISDRDLARTEADSYRSQLEGVQSLEKQHLERERDLADQLHATAQQVEDLAAQVRAQVEANAALRARLADTIARGEAEQRVSTQRIAGMQKRLRTLEEQVVAAQTSAEERVARHEEELTRLREAHSSQLLRLRDASGARRCSGSGTTRLFPPKSPLSPLFANANRDRRPSSSHSRMSMPLSSPGVFSGASGGLLSPRAAAAAARPTVRRSTTDPSELAGEDMSSQVETLRARVAELEGALASADAEMQEVVGRMGAAQMEVMRLQEQREEAVRETRRLEALLRTERERVKALEFEKGWAGITGAAVAEAR